MHRHSSLFRLALPGAASAEDLPVDDFAANSLLAEAETLGVFPATYSSLRAVRRCPQVALWQWRFQTNSARNLLLQREQVRLLGLLREAGVAVLPIRGVALTEELYPDLACREVGDIDLLVRSAEVVRAYGVLKGAGLADTANPWNAKALAKLSCRPAYLYPELKLSGEHGVSVELHWDWVEPELPESDLCQDAEGYLVYLCRHAAKHFWVDLRWLTDVELLLRREADGLDWDRYWHVARRVDAVRGCAGSLQLCARLFGRQLGEPEKRYGAGAGKRLARSATEWLVEGTEGRFRDRPVIQLLRVDSGAMKMRRGLSWLTPVPRHWTRPDGSTPRVWEVWLERYRRLGLLGFAAVCPAAGWRHRLSKAADLSSRDWSALLRAWLLLPVMGVGARRTQFPRLHAWAGRVRKVDTLPDPVSRGRRLAEMVDAAGRRHLVRYECLPRSLTLLRLLGRDGIRAELKMGVRRGKRQGVGACLGGVRG